MDIRVHEENPTKRVLDLSLDTDEVERHLDAVAKELQRNASLPGFRKGKVPRSILESRFGGSIQEEALEKAVNWAYQRAIQEKELQPISQPLVENVQYKKGEPLSFRVTIEIRPQIQARDYKEVPVTRTVRELPDSEVESALERICEETAQFIEVDRVAESDDIVVVDHVRVDDKGRTLKSTRVRDASLELGNEGLLPEFREALIGARAGESHTVEVKYPEDFGNEELAGRSARFHIKIKKVQEKKLRELDDNLAKEVFGLESLEELRSRIRLQMEGEERLRSRRELEEQLIEELLKRNEIPIPEQLSRRLTEDAVQRMGPQGEALTPEQRDQVTANYRRAVDRRIAREWLLDSISQQEKIEVSEQELGEELAKMTKAQGRAANEFRGLSPQERRQRVHDALLERKIFDHLIEISRVEEKKITEDRAAVTP